MIDFIKWEKDDEIQALGHKLRAHFTQSHFYAEWHDGRERTAFLIKEGEEIIGYFLAIKFSLIRQKNYYYLPYGPVLSKTNPQILAELKSNLRRIGDKNTVFVRCDYFPVLSDSVWSLTGLFRVPKIFYAGSYFQPRNEWYLDLNKPTEILLAEMHQKTRYSVRLAEKKGITTKIISSDFSEQHQNFFKLMSITAERNGFTLHPEAYYRNIFKRLDTLGASCAFLVLACKEETVLVADLIIMMNGVAHYVFGASSNEHRNLAPTYLAQWAAIVKAKELGCVQYNFGGVSAGDRHGWSGLTDFKMKFGGYLVPHSPFFDLVNRPFWYVIYSLRKLLK